MPGLGFYVIRVLGNPNSGPHAYVASALLNEPSPQILETFLTVTLGGTESPMGRA